MLIARCNVGELTVYKIFLFNPAKYFIFYIRLIFRGSRCKPFAIFHYSESFTCHGPNVKGETYYIIDSDIFLRFIVIKNVDFNLNQLHAISCTQQGRVEGT